jgi:hypothetical protein
MSASARLLRIAFEVPAYASTRRAFVMNRLTAL